MRKSAPLILVVLLSLGLAACGSSLVMPSSAEFDAAEELFLGATSRKSISDEINSGKDPIVIGASMAFSGAFQPFDDIPLKGAQLAIADINAKGGLLGRPLKLVMADAQSSFFGTESSIGIEATNAVIEEGAEMIMVSCHFDFGNKAAFQAQFVGKITFSSCAGSTRYGVQTVGSYIYNLSLAPTAQGAVLAEWAYRIKGWRNAYILFNAMHWADSRKFGFNSPILTDRAGGINYYKSLCTNFKIRWAELGGKITGEDAYSFVDIVSNADGYKSQVARVKEHGAADFAFLCTAGPIATLTARSGSTTVFSGGSFIVLPGGWSNSNASFVFDGPALIDEARKAGVRMPLLASESLDGAYWLGIAPNLRDFYVGVYGSMYGDDPNPRINEYVERFTELHGVAPITSHSLIG